MSRNEEQLLCPSAPAEPGSSLIAVLAGEARLAHISPALPVDRDFLAAASQHGPPEARMRFASPCVRSDCAQWTDSGCGVIHDIVAAGVGEQEPAKLPRCAIRGACRWYRQEGGAACRACPLILTDVSPPRGLGSIS
jgi:hypothetical protein